jgi:hypothetical protein
MKPIGFCRAPMPSVVRTDLINRFLQELHAAPTFEDARNVFDEFQLIWRPTDAEVELAST